MRWLTISGHRTPHVHSSLPLHSGHLDIRVLQDKRCKSLKKMMKKVQIYKNQNYKKLAIWTSESCKTKDVKVKKNDEKSTNIQKSKLQKIGHLDIRVLQDKTHKNIKKVQRNKNTKKTFWQWAPCDNIEKKEYLWTMCEKKGQLTSQMMGARKKQGTSCHWIPSLYLWCNI